MNVLFLCPHGAAKSVLAMIYFEWLAAKENLTVNVKNAGTEPDSAINPKVDAQLKTEGIELSGFVPPLLRDEDLEEADLVVSIGCISAESIPADTRYLDWSDVPMLSDDFDVCRSVIFEKVEQLVADLT